ncbi:MAG: hypothetical protein OEW67_14090 [Cyclobacteriaceae bacterium]|nr:hypothetical protein [Cyclobacteriaceae bacterium]
MKLKRQHILLIGLFVTSISYAQTTFEQLLDKFPEYNLPLDPQSLPYPAETLPITTFNVMFFNYETEYPYIYLSNDEKSHASLAGKIENEIIEYSPGKFDTQKIYPLGKINLHPNYVSLIFCKTNMFYDYIFIYNFDSNGVIQSGFMLTVKDNKSSTYRASLKEYSFIKSDGIIDKRNFGEEHVQNVTLSVENDGIFKVLVSEDDATYYNDIDWGINKKLVEINQFAADGVPILKVN